MFTDKERAGTIIRALQENRLRRLGLNLPIPKINMATQVLNYQNELEKNSKSDEDYIYSNGYRHPKELEKSRWKRTREILNRIEPGPYEDLGYFHMCARHAATFELQLIDSGSFDRKYVEERLDRILIATEPELVLNAEAQLLENTNYTLVWLSVGLMQYVYQLAKIVTLSWHLEKPATESQFPFFSSKIEDVEAVLKENPEPLTQFIGLLENYLVNGIPRYQYSQMPDPNRQNLIGQLTKVSERFVIYHEFIHAIFHFAPELRHVWYNSKDLKDLGLNNLDHYQEFQADLMAFSFMTRGLENFDGLPLRVSLRGPLLVLQAIDIFYRALDVICLGKIKESHKSDTHPAPINRTMAIIEMFKLEASRQYDLGLQQNEKLLGNTKEEFVQRSLDWAFFPSQTLELLWEQAMPKLLSLRNSIRLHQIWQCTDSAP
jgi:hypothetical protein